MTIQRIIILIALGIGKMKIGKSLKLIIGG
jgi:hypothetical protein